LSIRKKVPGGCGPLKKQLPSFHLYNGGELIDDS